MGRPRTTRFFVGMVAGLPHAILSMECPDMLTPERGTLPRPPNIAPAGPDDWAARLREEWRQRQGSHEI